MVETLIFFFSLVPCRRRFGLTRRLHGQHVGAGIPDGRTTPFSLSTGVDGITFLAGR